MSDKTWHFTFFIIWQLLVDFLHFFIIGLNDNLQQNLRHTSHFTLKAFLYYLVPIVSFFLITDVIKPKSKFWRTGLTFHYPLLEINGAIVRSNSAAWARFVAISSSSSNTSRARSPNHTNIAGRPLFILLEVLFRRPAVGLNQVK